MGARRTGTAGRSLLPSPPVRRSRPFARRSRRSARRAREMKRLGRAGSKRARGALGADRPTCDPFVNARGWGLSQIIKNERARATDRGAVRWTRPNLTVERARRRRLNAPLASGAAMRWARMAARLRLVTRLGGHSALRREEARPGHRRVAPDKSLCWSGGLCCTSPSNHFQTSS
jgi:hypothetical protein